MKIEGKVLIVTTIFPGTGGQEASVAIKGEFYHLTVNKKDTHTDSAIDGAVFELRHNGIPVSLTKTSNGKYMPGNGSAQSATSGGKAVIEYLPVASGY